MILIFSVLPVRRESGNRSWSTSPTFWIEQENLYLFSAESISNSVPHRPHSSSSSKSNSSMNAPSRSKLSSNVCSLRCMITTSLVCRTIGSMSVSARLRPLFEVQVTSSRHSPPKSHHGGQWTGKGAVPACPGAYARFCGIAVLQGSAGNVLSWPRV